MPAFAEPRRTVRLLFLCQALLQAAMTAQVVMSPLVGFAMAPNPALATLPMAVQMAASMAVALPAASLFARFGRQPVFLTGAFCHLLAVLTAGLALWQGQFALFCLGSALHGFAFGIGQQYRFAAAEVAGIEGRARAISLTLAGGVIGAIAGPELVTRSNDLVGGVLFLGTYGALLVLPLLATLLLTLARLPPVPPRIAVPISYREIMRRPGFGLACTCAIVAWATMNLVMSSTPIAMVACGFGAGDGARVIQMHAVAMFAPSFVTGRLIARFGTRRVLLVGALLSASCALIGASGVAFTNFGLGLVLLGVGWNFMFVSATTLLSCVGQPAERTRVQGLNDLLMFGTVALMAFSSGAFYAAFGWAALNLAILPPLGVVGWLMLRPAVPETQPLPA